MKNILNFLQLDHKVPVKLILCSTPCSSALLPSYAQSWCNANLPVEVLIKSHCMFGWQSDSSIHFVMKFSVTVAKMFPVIELKFIDGKIEKYSCLVISCVLFLLKKVF